MKALQYIYTSWKNGDSTEKGYMVYSCSEGISEEECKIIKDVMRYRPPDQLPLAPTEEEITEIFPYSFAYFTFPSGRACVAQSTYLGKDYTGRYGNYIVYALVFDKDDLPCLAAELFAEPYIKTEMTEEELNADSPVPPLPPLELDSFGLIINDDQICEFISEREEEFAQLIALVLYARDKHVPLYLNDTRENLVQWVAAVQRVLPRRLAKDFSFDTYVYDQDVLQSQMFRNEGIDFCIVGVRPDAHSFNYATECRDGRTVVMDLLDGNITEGVVPGNFAKMMATSATIGFDETCEFEEFLIKTSFTEINGELENAYNYYRLLKYGEFAYTSGTLHSIISFGETYCNEVDNADVATSLLTIARENDLKIDFAGVRDLWGFTCKYASYMIFMIFDLLITTIDQECESSEQACDQIDKILIELKENTPDEFQSFISYVNSEEGKEKILPILSESKKSYKNQMYLKWILSYFSFDNGLIEKQPVSEIAIAILNNISTLPDSEPIMVKILIDISASQRLFEDIFSLFINSREGNPDGLNLFYQTFVSELKKDPTKSSRCEELLFQIPASAPLAVKLCKERIRQANDPDQVFWSIYEMEESSLINKDLQSTITPLAETCINSLNSPQKEKEAVEMVRKLREEAFDDEELTILLTDLIEKCNVKFLYKVSRPVLQKAHDYRDKIESGNTNKVDAVIFALALEESQNRSSYSGDFHLGRDIAQMEFDVSVFDKNDYEYYVKTAFVYYFATIASREDTATLFRFFYHPMYYGIFLDAYFSKLKNSRKKETVNWMELTAWTCMFVLSSSLAEKGSDELYKPTLKFLKSCDTEDIQEIRGLIEQEDASISCDSLFEKAMTKESFSQKFTGLFKRNR